MSSNRSKDSRDSHSQGWSLTKATVWYSTCLLRKLNSNRKVKATSRQKVSSLRTRCLDYRRLHQHRTRATTIRHKCRWAACRIIKASSNRGNGIGSGHPAATLTRPLRQHLLCFAFDFVCVPLMAFAFVLIPFGPASMALPRAGGSRKSSSVFGNKRDGAIALENTHFWLPSAYLYKT